MTQEMLNKLNFQLTQSDWQIKKEPLHLVFKTCQCCTRRVEMWSDKGDDTDAFGVDNVQMKAMMQVWNLSEW